MSFKKNFFQIFIFVVIFFISAFPIEAEEFRFNFNNAWEKTNIDLMEKRSLEMNNQQNIGTFLVVGFIIGNAVAWSMGAYPKSFPQIPYPQDEQDLLVELQEEVEKMPDEADSLTQLGSLYFLHNELNQAEKMLARAKELSPDEVETLAWWYANEAKQAGAMWDFTFGIWKLNRLKSAIKGINKTLDQDPENVMVRLIHLNTLSGAGERTRSFDRVFEDEQWFLSHLQSNPEYFPSGVLNEFYTAITKGYLKKFDMLDDSADEKKQAERSLGKAESYLKKLENTSQKASQIETRYFELKLEFMKKKEG